MTEKFNSDLICAMTNNPGTDYGNRTSNIDKETGIRYGVISQHTVGEFWYSDAEADYGKPTCPECGGEVLESSDEKVPEEDSCDKDYYCPQCKTSFYSDSCFCDEPIGWSYEDDKYTLTDCLDNDIFVLKSPYFTYAQFCSPCVPGGCNLDSPLNIQEIKDENYRQNKAYCLGPEWFEKEIAPYPVYSVETGELISE